MTVIIYYFHYYLRSNHKLFKPLKRYKTATKTGVDQTAKSLRNFWSLNNLNDFSVTKLFLISFDWWLDRVINDSLSCLIMHGRACLFSTSVCLMWLSLLFFQYRDADFSHIALFQTRVLVLGGKSSRRTGFARSSTTLWRAKHHEWKYIYGSFNRGDTNAHDRWAKIS